MSSLFSSCICKCGEDADSVYVGKLFRYRQVTLFFIEAGVTGSNIARPALPPCSQIMCSSAIFTFLYTCIIFTSSLCASRCGTSSFVILFSFQYLIPQMLNLNFGTSLPQTRLVAQSVYSIVWRAVSV